MAKSQKKDKKTSKTELPPKKLAKPAAKSAAKIPTKPSKPASAKAAVKAKTAPASKKPQKVEPAKKTPISAAKPSKSVAAKTPVSAAKKLAKPAAKSASKAPAKPSKPAPAKAAVKAKTAPASKKPQKAEPAKKAPSPVAVKAEASPALELFKCDFFFEVPVGSATVRKTKTSIVQASPSSKKAAKDEETHDELLARIERDLQKARVVVRKGPRSMVCTKCCINPVDEAFIVDRDTAYCTECALMLGLGHTREARHQNFHPSLMKDEEAGAEA
jgi:hypothetical protein